MEKVKPVVKLIGNNGNAFAILGSCSSAARKAQWSAEKVKEFQDKATAGNYDHLLRVVGEYFEIR